MVRHFPPMSRGINWFPHKTVRVGYVLHFVELENGQEWGKRISRVEAARWLRTIKSLRADGHDIPYVIRWEWHEMEVNACSRCGARPSLYEADCDGWIDTGLCGHDACPGTRIKAERNKRRGC